MNRIFWIFAAGALVAVFTACTQQGGREAANEAGSAAIQTPSKAFSLTIYSNADAATFDPRLIVASDNTINPFGDYSSIPGFAVVRDTRTVELQKGVNYLVFRGIPANIDPTSVLVESLSDPGSVLLMATTFNYAFDSSDALLQRYIGQEIIVKVKPGPKDQPPSTFTGELVSVDGNYFYLRTADKAHPIQIIPRNNDIASVALAEPKNAPANQPELDLRVNALQAGQQDMRITFHSMSMSWRADYNLTFTDDKDQDADLRGWVSVVNQSMGSYHDANIQLVSGDVRRFELQPPQVVTGDNGAGTIPEYFKENPPFEGHEYSLGRASLPDQSITQVDLFRPRMAVSAEKGYAYDHSASSTATYAFGPWLSSLPPGFSLDNESHLFGSVAGRINYNIHPEDLVNAWGLEAGHKIDVVVKIRNTSENHLGLSLPAGRVREYQRQANGEEQFLGEDVIDHIAPDEMIALRAGVVPGVSANTTVVGSLWNRDGKPEKISYKMVLHNKSRQPIRVDVREHLYPGAKWWITDKTDAYETADPTTIFFPVDVSAVGERIVYYTVNYNYAHP